MLRNAGPNNLKTNGIGTTIVAIQRRSVPAYSTQDSEPFVLVDEGNRAAIADQSMMFAATVDAALYEISEEPSFRHLMEKVCGIQR